MACQHHASGIRTNVQKKYVQYLLQLTAAALVRHMCEAHN